MVCESRRKQLLTQTLMPDRGASISAGVVVLEEKHATREKGETQPRMSDFAD